VLLDSILQHEEVALIKQAMQQALVPPAPPVGADQQQQQQQQLDYGALQMVHQAAAGSGHYVTRLLSRVSPAVVADVLSWNSDQWHDFVEKAAMDLSLLLQMTCRSSHPGQEQQQEHEQEQEQEQEALPPYVHVAEQKLQLVGGRAAVQLGLHPPLKRATCAARNTGCVPAVMTCAVKRAGWLAGPRACGPCCLMPWRLND
jgi:hypothetical protein